MSRQNAWLHQEAAQWEQEGIITPEQREALQARYPLAADDGGRSLITRLLLAFAGLLVGVGLLLFVAANWDGMSHAVRLGLMFVVMLGAYGGGWFAYRRGHDGYGVSLTLLGTIAFGAGIFLIGQMYHLMSYNALSVLLWGAVTLAVAYVTRSRFIFCAALVELLAYDFAQGFAYERADWLFVPVMLCALPFFRRKEHRSGWVASLYLLVLTAGVARILGENEWAVYGIPTYALLVYVVGLFIRRRSEEEGTWVQVVGVRLAALWMFADVASRGEIHRLPQSDASATVCGAVFGVLLVAALGMMLWNKRWRETGDLLFFLALPLERSLSLGGYPILEGILFAGASLLWVLQGAREKYRLNNGSLLFIGAAFALYIGAARELLSGAAGFLIGGVVLFVIAALVEMNRRAAQSRGRGKKG